MAGITPEGKTQILLDTPEVTLSRAAIHIRRDAADVGKGVLPGAPRAKDVFKVGGEAILLRLVWSEKAQTVKQEWHEKVVIPAAHVDVAPGLIAHDMWSAPALPGIVPDTSGGAGSVVATGLPMWEKEPDANGSYECVLSAAADALPAPPPDDDTIQTVPLDRVLSGKISYAENTPFRIDMLLGAGHVGHDTFANFYFGGSAAVTPTEAAGGHFCLSLRGSGTGVLWELDDHDPGAITWKRRKTFAVGKPHPSGEFYWSGVWIVPYSKDRMAIKSLDGTLGAGYSVVDAFVNLARTAIGVSMGVERNVYREDERGSGHAHVRSMTGPGKIDVDLRRDIRGPFHVLKGHYVTEGIQPDGPVLIKVPLPAGTPLSCVPDVELPAGCTVTTQLYDVATNAPLPQDSDGNFLTLADGIWKYYPVFTFTGTGDQTPVFWGWDLDVAGAFVANTGTGGQVVSTNIRAVRQTGPDTTPDHESFSCTVHDKFGVVTLPRFRDKIRSEVRLVDRGTGALITRLFEGETGGSRAKLRWSAKWKNWYDLDLRMQGLWARLAEQISLELTTFYQDPLAPIDPATGRQKVLTWKATDVIRYGLNSCGFRDDELDIPDYPVRLWPGGTLDSDDFLVSPGTSWGQFIQKLAKEYLGMILIRDPNAGARGMWRLLFNPQAVAGGTPLWSFVLERPGGSAGKSGSSPGTYGTRSTFIIANSLETWPVAPECNFVVVTATGELLGEPGDGKGLVTQVLYNRLSFDMPGVSTADPSSPDYLGRMVPVLIFDPTLKTQAAVNYTARRTYDFSAHAEKWFSFYCPMIYGWDSSDTIQVNQRIPRINDLALVAGFPALIKNANPEYDSDRKRVLFVEGRFL